MRAVLAGVVGFVVGWLANFAMALHGSKFNRPAAPPADDPFDVLPTDDEAAFCCKAPSAGGYLCTEPTGHSGIHLAQDTTDEVCDVWPAA